MNQFNKLLLRSVILSLVSALSSVLTQSAVGQVAFSREEFAPFIEGLPVFHDSFDNRIAGATTIVFDSGVDSTQDIAFPIARGRNEVIFERRYQNVIDGNGDNGPTRITWTFPEPITRVGFDYFGAEQNGVTILVALNGGEPSIIELFEFPGFKSDGFIGIGGSQPYNEIAFVSRRESTNTFQIDNLMFATLPENITPLVWRGLNNSYDTNFNWAPRRPPESFDSVVFGDSANLKTVPLQSSRTVVAATFDGTGSYSIGDSDPNITLTATESISVTAAGASHTISGGVSTPVIDVASGSSVILPSSVFGSILTTKSGPGKVQLGSNNPRVTQPFDGTFRLAEGTLAFNSSDALGSAIIEVDSRVRIDEQFGSSAGAFALNGAANLSNGSVQLTPVASNQIGTLVSTSPLATTAVNRFEAVFDFQIGGGTGADGLSFSLLDANIYDNTALYGENGPPGNSLTISFDTFDNSGEGENVVILRQNGVPIASAVPSFDLENNLINNAVVTYDGSALSMTVRPSGGANETLFNAVPINNFSQTASHVAFSGRTGGATNEHRVDNVFLVADVNAKPTIEYAPGLSISNSLFLSSDVEFNVPAGTATQTGIIQTNTGISSSGSGIAKSGSGTLVVTGSNSYSGDTTVAGGTLLVNNLDGSATGTGNVLVTTGGALGGIGSIAGNVMVAGGGTLSPGSTLGILTVGGVVLNANATLSVDLAGVSPGAGHDQLVVNGDANITDAILNISLVVPFALTPKQQFDILTVDGTLSGQFAGLTEGGSAGTFGGVELFISYQAGDGNDIALFTRSGLNGDFNDDGFVNLADYTLWRHNLGSPAGTLLNDSAGGVIGSQQYELWKTNFGASIPPNDRVTVSAPEPSALPLLALSGLLYPLRNRTKLVDNHG